MTSSNGNIFRVTGLLCGEFTGHRWIPRTKASDAELWCFLWYGWVNNREADHLRRYRAHYDVTAMYSLALFAKCKIYHKSLGSYINHGVMTSQHIEAETKLAPLCRPYFQMYFHQWKSSYMISLKFIFHKHPVNNKPAMFQVMAWCQTGDMPLSTSGGIIYWRIYASLGLDELMT